MDIPFPDVFKIGREDILHTTQVKLHIRIPKKTLADENGHGGHDDEYTVHVKIVYCFCFCFQLELQGETI